ncbi:transposable element Tc3 transposase [Trichonephila clavipes]|nr:transposable element Tc3 transposase [Trichonephila clavipes]
MVELLDDWNVDVPSWKYSRNLELPRVSSPGFGNYSKRMGLKKFFGDFMIAKGTGLPGEKNSRNNSTLPFLNTLLEEKICLASPRPYEKFSVVRFRSLSSRAEKSVLSRWIVNMESARYPLPPIERHGYGGAGWLVWGGIILGSRTDLHVQSVTMTGHIYRDVILKQNVRLLRGAMGAEFLFMDDNARPHRANIVDECLQLENITRMDWPAYSPDLNPIEHVWNMLGREVAARQSPPTCLPELRRALLDEWCNIPQDQIDNLILSMPRRCKACVASSERHTPY